VITHVDIRAQGTNATDLPRKLAEASPEKKKAISGSMS